MAYLNLFIGKPTSLPRTWKHYILIDKHIELVTWADFEGRLNIYHLASALCRSRSIQVRAVCNWSLLQVPRVQAGQSSQIDVAGRLGISHIPGGPLFDLSFTNVVTHQVMTGFRPGTSMGAFVPAS